jgi:tRNA-2-methylthio-N6-dimethylallyladenosine synthase
MLILQDAISKEKNLELEGKVLDILVEGESKNNPEYLAGRTEGGKTVNFKADKNVIGKIIPVKIVEAKTWSLTGEIV